MGSGLGRIETIYWALKIDDELLIKFCPRKFSRRAWRGSEYSNLFIVIVIVAGGSLSRDRKQKRCQFKEIEKLRVIQCQNSGTV